MQGSMQAQPSSSSAAEQLAVETRQREGRQLVTTHLVAAGAVLFSEKPYAHALQRTHMSKVPELLH